MQKLGNQFPLAAALYCRLLPRRDLKKSLICLTDEVTHSGGKASLFIALEGQGKPPSGYYSLCGNTPSRGLYGSRWVLTRSFAHFILLIVAAIPFSVPSFQSFFSFLSSRLADPQNVPSSTWQALMKCKDVSLTRLLAPEPRIWISTNKTPWLTRDTHQTYLGLEHISPSSYKGCRSTMPIARR